MRKALQKIQKVEINSFIDKFVKARQKYFTQGQEWLEAELAEEKIYVSVNEKQLEAELDELVRNSLKHSTAVSLEMRIQVKKAMTGAKICYTDNGAGTWRNRSLLVTDRLDGRLDDEKNWGVQIA